LNSFNYGSRFEISYGKGIICEPFTPYGNSPQEQLAQVEMAIKGMTDFYFPLLVQKYVLLMYFYCLFWVNNNNNIIYFNLTSQYNK
jgi:hypothetical protein